MLRVLLFITLLSFSKLFGQSVQVVHLSPDTSLFNLKVAFSNDTSKFYPLAYKQSTLPITLPEGKIKVAVIKQNAQRFSQRLVETELSLNKSSQFGLLITGLSTTNGYLPNPDGQNTNLTLIQVDFGIRPEDTTQTRILIQHRFPDKKRFGVSFDKTPSYPALSYGSVVFDTLLVPDKQYILRTHNANRPSERLESFELSLIKQDRNKTVCIVGTGFEQPKRNNFGPRYEWFAIRPAGTITPLNPIICKLQFSHNIGDIDSIGVEVRRQNNLQAPELYSFQSIGYRTGTPFLTYPADSVPLEFKLINLSNNTILNKRFSFIGSKNVFYSLIINGLSTPQGFSNPLDRNLNLNYSLFRNTLVKAPDTSIISAAFIHGSTDCPAVNFSEQSQTIPYVNNADYLQQENYFEIPVDTLAFELELTANPDKPIQRYDHTVFNRFRGSAGILYTSGFYQPERNKNRAPLTLLFLLPDGRSIPLNRLWPVSRPQKKCSNEPKLFSALYDAVSDLIQIKINYQINELFITSLTGEVIYKSAGNPFDSTGLINIDSATLSNGIYCITALGNKGWYSEKITLLK